MQVAKNLKQKVKKVDSLIGMYPTNGRQKACNYVALGSDQAGPQRSAIRGEATLWGAGGGERWRGGRREERWRRGREKEHGLPDGSAPDF